MVSYCSHFYFPHFNQSSLISPVSSVFPEIQGQFSVPLITIPLMSWIPSTPLPLLSSSVSPYHLSVCFSLSLCVLCVMLGSFRFSFRLVMHPYNTLHQCWTYISFGEQIRSSSREQWRHLLFVHTLVIRCGTLTLPQSMLFPFYL